MNRSGPTSDIPGYLRDPETGTLRYCKASIDFVVSRLISDPDASLSSALRGLEPLFDKIFQNLNFSGVSFSVQDLRGMNFTGCRFDNAHFDGALIAGAIFRGAKVSRDALTGAGDWPEAVVEDTRRAFATMGTAARAPRLAAPLHGAWALLSEAHHLPELMLLPADLQVDDLPFAHGTALREGRLAIGRRPVTRLELAVLKSAKEAVEIVQRGWTNIRRHTALSESDPPELAPQKVGLGAVEDFLTALNHQVHAGYVLPTPGLLKAVRDRARASAAPFRYSGDAEFSVSGSGQPQVAGWSHAPVPIERSITFSEHVFRVLRIFEGTKL